MWCKFQFECFLNKFTPLTICNYFEGILLVCSDEAKTVCEPFSVNQLILFVKSLKNLIINILI